MFFNTLIMTKKMVLTQELFIHLFLKPLNTILRKQVYSDFVCVNPCLT